MDETELYATFLQIHQPQLELSNVPQIFWESVCRKLRNRIFDANQSFQLLRIDYSNTTRGPLDPIWKLFVSADKDIYADDPNNIYLIDHAWVYDLSGVRRNLSSISGLLNRMCALMGFDIEKTKDEKIKLVMEEMWRYNQTFSLSTRNYISIKERLPMWYVLDEVGSGINHSDHPNFRTVPFLHLPEGVTYTLLFPIEDIENGDEVTRDFVEGQTYDLRKRDALLLPWREVSFSTEHYLQEEPEESYFLSGRILETLPEVINPETLVRDKSKPLKVYTDYPIIDDYLCDSGFVIVYNEAEADILWYTTHFKEFKELADHSPHVFVNQFPFEHVVTVKDLLSVVCRRKATDLPDTKNLKTYPVWLPTTYNLNTELVEFVAYFENRRLLNLDNHWICKPWNLARGLDIHVTNNLFQILRVPSTGPKIAQKYITEPVLFERAGIGKVKFDIRYVVLLKSVKPLKVFVYRHFFLRFANMKFALDNLDVYEQHFTVMNYKDPGKLYHLKCAEFILEWEKQYPEFSWTNKIEPQIFQILRDVFEAATSVKPPKGIAHNPQSRALYAVDLILEWQKDKEDPWHMQPMLLEINFSPDCRRACEYYANFYDDIFKCLFLGDTDPEEILDLFPGNT
ncbi:tubulin tyrosine ligase-like 12 [Lasioglossum baleicum]|uniref:tubulin tyrosine ligase-like 12 n=1 Tax=Lasioglossum baleicum TaxID=434251 RepID=UPI003FCEDB5F